MSAAHFLSLLLALDAPVADTPRTFVEQLYARYSNTCFNSLNEAERFYTPAFVAALDENFALAVTKTPHLTSCNPMTRATPANWRR